MSAPNSPTATEYEGPPAARWAAEPTATQTEQHRDRAGDVVDHREVEDRITVEVTHRHRGDPITAHALRRLNHPTAAGTRPQHFLIVASLRASLP